MNSGVSGSRGLKALTVFDTIFQYCHPDSLIPVASLRPTRRDPLGPPAPHGYGVLRVADLYEMFPAVLAHLWDQTVYTAHNPLKKTALQSKRYDWSTPGGEPETRDATYEDYREDFLMRKTRHFGIGPQYAAELAAITIDLDVGRPGGPTVGQALGGLVDLVVGGYIPDPAMIALSGQGMYALWLLRSDECLHPPKATPENTQLWREVCSTFLERLSHLKADPISSRDITHWYKCPETIDTKTNTRVRYLFWRDGDPDHVPRYSLKKLCGIFSIPLHSEPPSLPTLPASDQAAPRIDTHPGQQAAALRVEHLPSKRQSGKAGNPAKPHITRVEELRLLAIGRGGIKEGHRHIFLYYFYRSLCNEYLLSKHPKQTALPHARKETHEINTAYCRPPFSAAEVDKACAGNIPSRFKSQRIVEKLGITESEAYTYQLKMLKPQTAKMREHAAKEKEREKRATKAFLVDQALRDGWDTRKITSTYRDQGVTRQYVRYHRNTLKERGELDHGPQHAHLWEDRNTQ